MRGQKKGRAPRGLLRAAKRFADWRRTRALGARIPESLWTLAVELATTYGVCQTAVMLRLDYYGLKKRLEAKVSQPDPLAAPSQRPKFVELAASTLVAPGECVIEWENAAGAKMRVHLKGTQTPDLVALSGSFWKAKP